MNLFGLTVTKALPATLNNIPSSPWRSWLTSVREAFSGAWQRNMECEPTKNIAAFATIYACVSLISNDIAKLRIKLVELLPNGVWKEIENAAFSPVLRKPNRYQTRIQFLAYWLVSKLFYGNTYILLERDQRRVVIAEYVLDPKLVTPLIADDGAVYYRLGKDYLSGIETDDIVVPASEIIHDRMNCLFHPLVGIGPIYAAAHSATHGLKIQGQSSQFFSNNSRPVGLLTVPGNLGNDQAKEFKQAWDSNYGPGGIGGTAVLGGGMTYVPMAMPAIQAQLIEQLRWTVEDCARPFHVPLHKLGMGQPTLNNIGALNQDYYAQALQTHIESIELLLDEALGLPALGYGVELDLDGLLRMDQLSIAETGAKLVGSGIQAPNEARLKMNLEPVEGGDSPYLQQQNYSLEDLSTRSAKPDPFATTPPPAPALPAPPADDAAKTDEEFAVFMSEVTKGLEYV